MNGIKRGGFGSRTGAIAAAAGSAIGLGNIWRFPYVAGENGGAAFIIIYLALIIFVGLPIMMSEFSIGRYTQTNVFGSFKKLAPKGKWYLIGVLGIASAFVILSFYCVVAGWTMSFLQKSITNTFAGMDPAMISTNFDAFIASGWKPIMWMSLFIILTSVIVVLGIEKGIERYNKILMPVLIVILLLLCINSMTLDGLKEGMAFMFTPDFSKITPNVILNAMGQAFFSLSLGMGTIMTYGSYIRKQDNMLFTASSVALADIIIAILAGIAIFPAVFSFGIEPSSGPDLVFKTLPNIFAQMTGGYILSILFFILLVVASLTSSVSVMEVLVAYCSEELKVSRLKSVILISATVIVTGGLCAMSQIPGSAIAINGENLFNIFDNGSSSYMLPIGGLLIVIFTGWRMNEKYLKQELSSDGAYKIIYYPVFRFIIKFVAPVAISLIFLSKIGLI